MRFFDNFSPSWNLSTYLKCRVEFSPCLDSIWPSSCKRNESLHRKLSWNSTRVELSTGWNFSCEGRVRHFDAENNIASQFAYWAMFIDLIFRVGIFRRQLNWHSGTSSLVLCRWFQRIWMSEQIPRCWISVPNSSSNMASSIKLWIFWLSGKEYAFLFHFIIFDLFVPWL